MVKPVTSSGCENSLISPLHQWQCLPNANSLLIHSKLLSTINLVFSTCLSKTWVIKPPINLQLVGAHDSIVNCIVSSQIFFSFVSEIKSIYLINGMFSKHEQAKCKKEDLNQQTHQPAMDRLNDNDDSLMWDLNWNNLYLGPLGPQCRQKCGQSNTMQNTIHASNGSIVPIFL